jgi:hypothetical protein
VRNAGLEKSSPSGDFKSARAIDVVIEADFKPRREMRGFLLSHPSPALPKEMEQMNDLRNQLQGLWLPLVTPFRDGELDEPSLRRLIRHYANGPVDGLILAATSGEGMMLTITELERLVTVVRDELAAMCRRLPLCLGL